MRYNVPQFIDIEDKIFGPLTFKQAIYSSGGVFGAFIIFYILGKISTDIPIIIKIILATPILIFGLSLAFLKINKRPFIYFVEAFLKYHFNSKRYIWKQKDNNKKTKNEIKVDNVHVIANEQYIPKFNRSKLKEIAWSLDMDID